jgi:hypothetical protein
MAPSVPTSDKWKVLNWNEPAIGFYRSLGAVPMEEWTVWRLTDEPLTHLVSSVGTAPASPS